MLIASIKSGAFVIRCDELSIHEPMKICQERGKQYQDQYLEHVVVVVSIQLYWVGTGHVYKSPSSKCCNIVKQENHCHDSNHRYNLPLVFSIVENTSSISVELFRCSKNTLVRFEQTQLWSEWFELADKLAAKVRQDLMIACDEFAWFSVVGYFWYFKVLPEARAYTFLGLSYVLLTVDRLDDKSMESSQNLVRD